MGWHKSGWVGSLVSVAQRRARSRRAPPVALSEVVDHRSLAWLELKTFAKASLAGSALKASYMSHYRYMAKQALICEMSPMLRRTPSTCAAHWTILDGQMVRDSGPPGISERQAACRRDRGPSRSLYLCLGPCVLDCSGRNALIFRRPASPPPGIARKAV
jgi:hypothetical protein